MNNNRFINAGGRKAGAENPSSSDPDDSQPSATKSAASAVAKARNGLPVSPKSDDERTPPAASGHAVSYEELVKAGEELKSRNEQLTGDNIGLQQEIERHRSQSRDLQNVLENADLATIFLDGQLNIRFSTPAPRQPFAVAPRDIGHGLADLPWIADDSHMLSDADAVLETGVAMEREIGAGDGIWYMRRVVPDPQADGGRDGLVITFTEVTDRHRAAGALAATKRDSEIADATKTRFLASASHDLRQPLQTLVLLQGLLGKMVHGTKQQELVTRIGETLMVMSGILNTLLDINQIEAGVVLAEKTDFPVNDLLERMHDEFTYHAVAKGISLRSVASSVIVNTDRLRLEQMVRNLCTNALKYTRSGKILLGCRRRGDKLSIEIWDTGLGIAGEEIGAIFDEYYQLADAGRERSRGLGLGLSIVKRLSELLGLDLNVKSEPGRGSMFSIEVPIAHAAADQAAMSAAHAPDGSPASRRTGSILVVDDDPEVLTLLEMLIRDEGHRIATAANGFEALELIDEEHFRPDLVIADLNLPNGSDGITFAAQVRARLGRDVPVIILTGDISTVTLRDIALGGCIPMHKPASPQQLTQTIQRELPFVELPELSAPVTRAKQGAAAQPVIFVVDDDLQLREAIRLIFEDEGHEVRTFATAEEFLASDGAKEKGCLLVDAHLPGLCGLELLATLRSAGHTLPAIMMTGISDVSTAIAAMKSGAIDFIEKPISRIDLLASVGRALSLSQGASAKRSVLDSATRHIASLTQRQRQIMALVLAGHPSKNIAADLGISQRTVENHRAAIMKKTGSKSIPALARLALLVEDMEK